VVYLQTRSALETCLGKETPIKAIGSLDAEKFRRSLVDDELAGATISKRVKTARAFFRLGVRWKMLIENPFDGLKAGGQTNRERMVFIPAEVVGKVIDEATSAEWKALIALARWCGLRTPSEHFAIRWGDIDWDKKRIVIHAAKTSGKEGREYRVVPLFAEVEPYLMAIFAAAPVGSEYVFNELRRPGVNLRTQFERFIKRAGVGSWLRLFQNLRSSRANELAEVFPAHVSAAWLGYTEAVARAHYLEVRDSDFEAAAKMPSQLSRGVNRVLAGGDKGGQGVSEQKDESPQTLEMQQGALVGAPCQSQSMTPTGFEPVSTP